MARHRRKRKRNPTPNWEAMERRAKREFEKNKDRIEAGDTFAGTPKPYRRRTRRHDAR